MSANYSERVYTHTYAYIYIYTHTYIPVCVYTYFHTLIWGERMVRKI